jgi:hypothetical protein
LDEGKRESIDTVGAKAASAQKRILSSNVALEGVCRIWRNMQRSLKDQQNQCHLQDRHSGLACESLGEISISLSIGIALPKYGYSSGE